MEKEYYDVQDIINAECNLEPIKCRYCGHIGEVTFNQYIGDAICEICGKGQLKEESLYMELDRYSDRTDASIRISLYEYGFIRNPNTNKCIICQNTYEVEDRFKPKISVQHISFDDVKEALKDASDGYFSFIGSTKEKELNELDNNYLSHHITALEMYNGYFNLNGYY